MLKSKVRVTESWRITLVFLKQNDFQNFEVFGKKIIHICSRYHHVMRRCWMEDPKCRPTFFELTEMMGDVVRQLRRGVSNGVLLDSHYERVSARSFTTSLTTNSRTSNDTIITDL